MEQDFAALVREYRRGMGWTQSVLAEKWSYSFETISAWERRKRIPSNQEIHRLSTFLNMTEGVLSEIVASSKGQARSYVSMASREIPAPPSDLPFPSGRLLWSLHLGMDEDGLQCVISCPLPSGESWQVALDPEQDSHDIQHVYQLVSARICRGTAGGHSQLRVV